MSEIGSIKNPVIHQTSSFRRGSLLYTSTLIVELPLGLKIQIKYRDSMTIDEMVHQVCQKAGINPEEHYLTYNNRELKMNSTCKDAGLYPNAMLKLYQGSKSSVLLDIQVSIRVKDVRIASVFKPTDNLWYILHRLCARETFDNKLVPIMIYMKHEFIGNESMKDITLRDLGITSGSCMFRFLQLKQEDLDQRKLKYDDVSQGTLESLDLIEAGLSTDAGVKNVLFSSIIEERAPSVMCIGGRNGVFFIQPAELDPKTNLHDEFFDTTIDEIHFMYNELQKTSEMSMSIDEMIKLIKSNLEKIKAKKSFQDETVIRIYFPNNHVIQALFAPEETIEDVKQYIKPFLFSDTIYNLYAKPERSVILSNTSRLGELGLVPTGKLYFDQLVALDQYFSPEVIPFITSYENAAEAALIVRGPSLTKFLNYSPEYIGGFMDKIMDYAIAGFGWVKNIGEDSSALTTKRNKLVPKWLQRHSSSESPEGGKYLPSFFNSSNESLSTEEEKKKFQTHRKSIGVLDSSRSWFDMDRSSSRGKQRPSNSSGGGIISYLKRLTKTSNN